MEGLQDKPRSHPKIGPVNKVNGLLYPKERPVQKVEVTKSTITSKSVDNAATNNKRIRTQAQVMNCVSATTVGIFTWNITLSYISLSDRWQTLGQGWCEGCRRGECD
jgi:hypothetical protein